MIQKSASAQLLIVSFCLLLYSSSFSQFDSLVKTYDLLSTIAGKGANVDGDENLWLEEFEGGKATDAILSGPHMAMADSMGNVYIADKNAHAIRKVNTEGIITTVAGVNKSGNGRDSLATTQALSGPNGLWVSKSGVLYILDLWNNKIRKVDLNGQMTTLIHDKNGMSAGRGLWVSQTEDTIWYCSGSVIKMWTEKDGLRTLADGFSGGLGNIVQDRNGNIIATDRSANLVYRIDKSEEKTIIAGNGASKGGGHGMPALQTAFHGVRGVWVLDDNSYFLATHEGSQVWYIDTAGIAYLFVNGKEGDKNHTGDGMNFRTPGYKVSEVRAITADYQGNLLITENDRGYIRRLDKVSISVMKRRKSITAKNLIIYQNRSQGITGIQFPFQSSERPTISIKNLLGQSLMIPSNYKRISDNHVVEWSNSDLPSGSFLITIQAENNPLITRQISICK